MEHKKIAFVANTSWYLYNFRLSLLKELVGNGWKVFVVAPQDKYSQYFEKHGISFISLIIFRRGINPFRELLLIWRIYVIYKRIQPDFLHHFTSKVVIYGSFAARLAGIKNVVSSITGLGYAFINKGILCIIVKVMYRVAFQGVSQVIFQNSNDKEMFLRYKLITLERAHLVKGSGVNTEHFASPVNDNRLNGNITFALISRMLWDKGVGEFIEAAKSTKRNLPTVKFLLVGSPDYGNPNTVPEEYLEEQNANDYIEWIEHVDDVKPFIDKSDVVVLPSYREGLPKVLLEAASCGRAIIATDVPGCREIVEHGINGLLIPPKDVNSLAESMLKLAKDPELRLQMGQNGRKKVLREFDDKIVIQKTIEVYKKVWTQFT
jgi:glycosyltransferase involved in cell wall biosynthesis